MEENGARLNRDRLASAYLLGRSLAARSGASAQAQSQLRRRAGAVQEAVIRVLAVAEGPLQAREIHAAAEKLAGTPLSWNTVKDCLHKNARRPGGLVERVSHGRYRHR
jgi:Fe2+ or Zn2+ uptake regulation protein